MTPPEKDYYQILGVAPTATPEQIKQAYREKAKLHHPDAKISDKHEPDVTKFRDVAEAYSVLSV